MHFSLESPLWITNPNTLDDTHRAGFGFRANFPLKSTPWNFVMGFSQYNYGQHVNLIDISNATTATCDITSIKFREGTYLLKYAGVPLGIKYDKKFWSTTFGVQPLFNINQAEVHESESILISFGIDDFEDFDKDKVNKFNASLNFSFEGKLPLGERWAFYLEPELQYLVKPVFQDGIDEVNRANIFLKVGIRHKIILPNNYPEANK